MTQYRRVKPSPIINKETLMNGGATAPTVEVYQRRSGFVRVYWYALGQDEEDTSYDTISAFYERNWDRAIERAREATIAYVGGLPGGRVLNV